MTWLRTSKGRTQALLLAFGLVALAGMLLAGTKYFVQGDQRQLVVTMKQGITDADRATLKADCGTLPGIGVVPDKGAADRQFRFPVRFLLRGATPQQEAALETCVTDHSPIVRGYLIEGGGN